ncbi:CD276 antigen isoform X2 [Cebidichthys violaceus]|uniref:CD276 antigen isoform X2 n=1 Tax=Cebidichthys violaceus TaxID=271503 RepID=UPI0035CB9086
MNMASMCILLIVTVITISVGNAKKEDFISLDCKAEQLGQYGQQSLLECVINIPNGNALIRVVTWKKASSVLLVFNKGNLTKRQGYSFAEPSWNLSNMNVSLLITNTAVEHDGLYECMVITDSGDHTESLSLKVTAKYSKPTIVSSPKAMTLITDGTLTCESDGGYPKGELRWFDENNRELTNDSPMEAKQTKTGLFQLSSKLVLGQISDVSKYTCSVFNASGGKEEETTFEELNAPNSPEKGFRKELDPATKIVAPVVVIGSLIAGLLIVMLILRRRSKREHHEVRLSDVEEGDDVCPDILA